MVQKENFEMKSRYLEMVGQRFGKVVCKGVFYRAGSSRVYAKLVCDCGNESESLAWTVLEGRVQSCGCGKRQIEKRRLKDIDINEEVKLKGASEVARQYGVSRQTVYKEIKRREKGV